jgi:hypothetical protein
MATISFKMATGHTQDGNLVTPLMLYFHSQDDDCHSQDGTINLDVTTILLKLATVTLKM